MPYKDPEKTKACKRRYNHRLDERKPWYRYFRNALGRCGSKEHHYYKAGIKCLFRPDDVKFLWERDQAYLMDYPSIHRKNNAENYTVENCEFIELSEHYKLRHLWKH
jgi:hypothetical protein